MTLDGPSVHPNPEGYTGGLDVRDHTERLLGHLNATTHEGAVKVAVQVYTANASGLTTSFVTVTPEEAEEFAAALKMAAGAARQQRYAVRTERFLAELGAVG